MLLILELDIDLSRLVEGNTLVDVDALDDPTLRHALLHELVDTVDPIDLTQRDHKSEGQVSGTGTVSALGAAEADGAVDGYTASTIGSAGCGPSRAGRPCRPSRSWVVMGRPSRSSLPWDPPPRRHRFQGGGRPLSGPACTNNPDVTGRVPSVRVLAPGDISPE